MFKLDRTDTPAGGEHATVYLIFELSKKTWQLGLLRPGSDKLSRYSIAGGDLTALASRLARCRAEAAQGGGQPVRILSCYEAGLDGHWLHRWLTGQGVISHEIDPSSIEVTAADIEGEELVNPGTYMLKRWLEYSASGVLDAGDVTPREPDSDFEIFVIEQIRSMGSTPVPQVGVAGYFIDIGVRHPDWPHGFILGVECDGASCHSAKSARDRDRLRQEVLENLGWQLHRIWSTDWFNNPQREAEKLRRAIAERIASLKTREAEFVKKPKPKVAPSIEVNAIATTANPQRAHIEDIRERPVSRIAEAASSGVAVGDTVRVRYLTDDKTTMQLTISKGQPDATSGIINVRSPIAQALLGMEPGEEVEVLIGRYIRRAVVEKIYKGGAKAAATG
jgi:hypothetical protein